MDSKIIFVNSRFSLRKNDVVNQKNINVAKITVS